MKDFLLESYFYHLPAGLIAQRPAAARDMSRLMILPRDAGLPSEDVFKNIGRHLPPGALLVLNNTRVLPARMRAVRQTGGKLEFLLLTPLPLLRGGATKARCLLKPAARLRPGEILELCPGLTAKIIEKRGFGQHVVELAWQGELEDIFRRHGSLPLPPYIRRSEEALDESRYQTVFARATGAVAAPTAGLHFTAALKEGLERTGIEFAEITLHVGYGTFSPVREADIRAHKMHAEYVEISPKAAEAIRAARHAGRPIVAVGTTSLRAMQGVIAARGEIVPYSGWTDVFIYPGKNVSCCSGLLTNFHLPRSSLLMLVAAFAGRARILNAYAEAVRKGFRFFSYGDAMLII